ncbi:hypothetical protein AX14_009541 [Amanita brunnescens Koide BX004]|nr:hypothetical protein AX14_009541 [Amanita brunnescens Koide BX004]
MPVDKGKRRAGASDSLQPASTGQSSKSAPKSSNTCYPPPTWLTMNIKGSVGSNNPRMTVFFLTGKYLVYDDPVLKVYRSQTGGEMHAIYNEVSNLRMVEQYIDGVFVRISEGEYWVFLLLKNMGVALEVHRDRDKLDHAMLSGPSAAVYKERYKMLHLDPNINNYARQHGQFLLNVIDWGFARHQDVPEAEFRMIKRFRSNKDLPAPPPPISLPEPMSFLESSRTELEKEIVRQSPTLLLGNSEANYYKFGEPINGNPAAVKVSWVREARGIQLLLTEMSNTIAVDGLIDVGMYHIIQERLCVAYLIIKFPGQLPGNQLRQNQRKKLRGEAIERYKKNYSMVNVRATVSNDDYFIYDVKKKMAYIYDWSSARHVALPSGALREICAPLNLQQKFGP